jgi:superfamily II DNA or RNA helicase
MIEFDYDVNKQLGIIKSELLTEIREHFSVRNEGAHFMRKYNRFIPQRTYAITPTGRFEPCLLAEIKKYLVSKQYTGQLKINEQLRDNILPAQSRWHVNSNFTYAPIPLKLELRDYQNEIVRKCLEYGRGTIVLATAGGKTLTAASILTNISVLYQNFKCLFIVPDRGLVEQTTKDFEEYKIPLKVTKWTGDDPLDLTGNIIVANLGIIQSKNSDLSWTKDIDVLFVDEVHKIRKGNEINKLFKFIKTPHRFGLTGTMPENLLDQWNIIGKIGPIIYEKHSYHLREGNYISGAEIQILQLNHRVHPFVTYREEIDTLIESQFRNDVINKIAQGLKNNTLILVDFIKHGQLLFNLVKQQSINKQVFFIRGEVDIPERERVRQLMEKNDNIVVIAISKIFSTGINIKNLHYIVFACGGKAKIKIVQSIGRGLRLHANKDKLIIFDIADNYNYSQNHLEKRITLYEKEKIKYSIKQISEN